MTELDQALLEYMKIIVFHEYRPFSYIDFIPHFELNEKTYPIEYGTLRNKFLMLRKKGEIELDYRTTQAYYTIKGNKFGKHKLMTSDHMGVQPHSNSDPIYNLIQNLPVGIKALHDIHMRFSVRNLWSVLSTNSYFKIDPISKDIRLPPLYIKGIIFKTTVHRTDTTTVVIGCSYRPIAVDVSGIISLSNALTRLEDNLTRLIEHCGKTVGDNENGTLLIPDHLTWIVTMWHFGTDSLREYTSEKLRGRSQKMHSFELILRKLEIKEEKLG